MKRAHKFFPSLLLISLLVNLATSPQAQSQDKAEPKRTFLQRIFSTGVEKPAQPARLSQPLTHQTSQTTSTIDEGGLPPPDTIVTTPAVPRFIIRLRDREDDPCFETSVEPIVTGPGTVFVAARSPDDHLSLWVGPSSSATPWEATPINYRYYSLNMQLDHPPVILYQPPSAGMPEGRLHFFGNKGNKLSYLWCNLEELAPGTGAPCANRAGTIFDGVSLIHNPDAVIMGNGRIFVFFQSTDGNKLAYAKGPGGSSGFEPSVLISTLIPGDERGRCGGIWYSPSATVKVESSGNEEIMVVARDNSFAGKILYASARRPASGPTETGWRCGTFDDPNAQRRDTGPQTLGSSPFITYNPYSNTYDVTGKEHMGDNRLIRWRINKITTADVFFLEPSWPLGYLQADYPLDQHLGAAVYTRERSAPSMHFFIRARNRDRPLGYTYISDVGTVGWFHPTLAVALANSAPTATVDSSGNLHSFAVGSTPSSPRKLVHFISQISPTTGIASEWRPERLEHGGVTGNENESAPSAIFVPTIYVP